MKKIMRDSKGRFISNKENVLLIIPKNYLKFLGCSQHSRIMYSSNIVAYVGDVSDKKKITSKCIKNRYGLNGAKITINIG